MIRLKCPRPPAARLTFSPDGEYLGAIGEAEVLCWCRSLGWELRGLHLSGSASGLAFHPSGRLLAYAGHPPTETGRPHPRSAGSVGTWGAHFYPLATDGAVEPAALHLVEGTPADGMDVVRFPALAFTPDGLTLVAKATVSPSFFSRSRPCVLHWHLAPTGGGWRALDTNPGRTRADTGAARAGGALVLVGEFGVTTSLLDPTRSDPLVVPDVAGARAVAAVGELVAAAGDRGVTVWHLRTPRRLAFLSVRDEMDAPALAFSPDGAALAVGTADGVTVWDPWTGARGPTFDFGVGRVLSVAYSRDGLLLAVSGRRGVVVADAG